MSEKISVIYIVYQSQQFKLQILLLLGSEKTIKLLNY